MSTGKQASLFTYFSRTQDEADANDLKRPSSNVGYMSNTKPNPTKVKQEETAEPEIKEPAGSSRKRRKLVDSDEDESFDAEEYIEKSQDNIKTKSAKGKKAGLSSQPTTKKQQNEDKRATKIEAPDEMGVEEMSNIAPKKFDENGNVNYDMFDDPTPWWALKEARRDANKRKQDDPDYDPNTLYIPAEELKKLTPARKQYWILKSQNMDKVIFFKLGKFYELFDQDAITGVQQLGLAFMGNKMHSGVPEVALNKFADQLVQLGYKVAIVEQTETERERQHRLSTSGMKGQDKVIKRDLIKVLTKGTYINPMEDSNSVLSTNYIWIFKKHSNGFALCISELSLNQCFIMFVPEDPNYSKLKMLVYQYRPNEIVVDPMYFDKETTKIFSNIASNPLVTRINNSEKIHFWNSMIMSSSYQGSRFLENLEDAIDKAGVKDGETPAAARSVFAGLVSYLNMLKILENHVEILDIKLVDADIVSTPGSVKNRMVLDSQALEQLEIIEATHDFRTKRDDSLLAAVDRCVTQSGKRYLKSMLCSPLMDIDTINQRLDAIEDLNKHSHFLNEFQKMVQKTGDIERVLARLFKYSVKQKERFVMFEDVSTTRLRELKTVLANLDKIYGFLINSSFNCQWTSKTMERLTNPISKGGVLTNDLQREVSDIEGNIVWTGPQLNMPVPKSGINKEYDFVKDQIRGIQTELDEYLISQKKALSCHSLEFAHSKNRYEISAPENMKVPNEYSFSSCRKGFKRYTTPTTIRLVDKMEAKEELLKEHMKDFALYVFEYFNKKRSIWENVSNIVKELDVLCSMAIYSFKSRGDFCRPILHSNSESPFIELKHSRHPVLSRLNEEFVPNDVSLGRATGDQIMLLTGPNMGGKSTILRQVCLISILAQIGCYIPAQKGEMTIVDRVFTRLGASDKLVEGKSTFFVEMEDLYNLVTFGTSSSLAIIDELGRGTSTADGYSIAASILDYMVKNIGCLSLFSTHYHSLINFCLDYDSINYWKMDYLIDDSTQNIHFLYKLAPGVCDRSFGIKLGRLAGIAPSILNRAEQVSSEIAEKHNATFVDEIENKYAKLQQALSDGSDLTTLTL